MHVWGFHISGACMPACVCTHERIADAGMHAAGQLVQWEARWAWDYGVQGKPYDTAAQEYLTRHGMRLSPEAWDALDEKERAQAVARKLWIPENQKVRCLGQGRCMHAGCCAVPCTLTLQPHAACLGCACSRGCHACMHAGSWLAAQMRKEDCKGR